MISALIASGTFLPGEHGLTIEDLSCYEKVWRFCADYQKRAGTAPGLQLLASRHPEFTFTPGVNVDWAAQKLLEESYGRTVRRTLNGVLSALGDNDYDAVTEALGDLQKPRRTVTTTGLNVFDPRNVAESETKIGMPVPFRTVADITRGVGMKEFWLLGGRLGHGKSQMLPAYAASIAEAGFHVRYLSCEMSKTVVNRRISRYFARGDKAMQLRLRNKDEAVRQEALAELGGTIPGSIETLDPADLRMTVDAIEDATRDVHVVFVDHMGLLMLNDGSRAIDDWRTMAKISNITKEINMRTQTAIFGAVQINRQGDTSGMRPPKISEFSQSDALGQDCDVGITIKQPCQGLLVHSLEKVREVNDDLPGSFHTIFYTRFDPSACDYREISREDATNLMLSAQDRMAES